MAKGKHEEAEAASAAPPEEMTRMVAPEGFGACGGPSGASYKPGRDGTVQVAAEDVEALLRLGFRSAE